MTRMKKSGGKHFSLVLTVALICLMTAVLIPGVMGVATPVNLGTAVNYTILSESGITGGAGSTITGDIAVSPIDSTAITGFGLSLDSSGTFSTSSLVTGKVYAANYVDPTPVTLSTAISNMTTAFSTANGQAPDATELGAGNIGGMTLAPGVLQVEYRRDRPNRCYP